MIPQLLPQFASLKLAHSSADALLPDADFLKLMDLIEQAPDTAEPQTADSFSAPIFVGLMPSPATLGEPSVQLETDAPAQIAPEAEVAIPVAFDKNPRQNVAERGVPVLAVPRFSIDAALPVSRPHLKQPSPSADINSTAIPPTIPLTPDHVSLQLPPTKAAAEIAPASDMPQVKSSTVGVMAAHAPRDFRPKDMRQPFETLPPNQPDVAPIDLPWTNAIPAKPARVSPSTPHLAQPPANNVAEAVKPERGIPSPVIASSGPMARDLSLGRQDLAPPRTSDKTVQIQSRSDAPLLNVAVPKIGDAPVAPAADLRAIPTAVTLPTGARIEIPAALTQFVVERKPADIVAQSRVSAMSINPTQDPQKAPVLQALPQPQPAAAPQFQSISTDTQIVPIDSQGADDSDTEPELADSQDFPPPLLTAQGVQTPSGRVPVAAPPNLHAQLMQHAAAALDGPVDLILAPEELGHIKFQIRHQGESVSIFLTAERPETLSMLRRHGEELLREFRDSGFSGATLDFGSWGQQQQPQRQTPAAFVLPDEFSLVQPIPRAIVPEVSSPLIDAQGLNMRL